MDEQSRLLTYYSFTHNLLDAKHGVLSLTTFLCCKGPLSPSGDRGKTYAEYGWLYSALELLVCLFITRRGYTSRERDNTLPTNMAQPHDPLKDNPAAYNTGELASSRE